jgi:DNA-binding response OmpR family regulator
MRILLVEDEPKIASFIQKGLNEQGYELQVAYDGKSGLSIAQQGDFDLIILDVMLPFINGLEICKKIRQADTVTPVLMLTALGTLDDKVEGLQQGADDYLVKPFHFKELIARIQALTRRKNAPVLTDNISRIADLTLDRHKKTVYRNNQEIILTAREYALLDLFIQNTNRLLTRSEIAEQVWGYNFDSTSNVIDVYVNYLRNKIEKGFSSKLIHTVVGMGYIMKVN